MQNRAEEVVRTWKLLDQTESESMLMFQPRFLSSGICTTVLLELVPK